MTRGLALTLALLTPALLGGCGGMQSAAGRDGSHGGLIADLFSLFAGVTGAIYILVLVLLVLAIRRGCANRRGKKGLQGEPPPDLERRWRGGLIAFAGCSAALLFGLSLATWFSDRGLAHASENPAVEVELIGHQWWWEVRYRDPVPSRIVRTANELHIPAGRTTHVKLISNDVIHSFWVPNLAGKQDLIPGRKSDLSLHPLRAGVYRAQCAEFCGLEHALMALDVTVEPERAYRTWYDKQLAAPPPPAGGPALTGYALFQTRQCSSCHTVAGTSASGMVAPDLSHVFSRTTIAAGTRPMNHRNLKAWIANPQALKPGNNMPKVPLSKPELNAITAYLETLT
jgi:cytochrome c oxidase subunit II